MELYVQVASYSLTLRNMLKQVALSKGRGRKVATGCVLYPQEWYVL